MFAKQTNQMMTQKKSIEVEWNQDKEVVALAVNEKYNHAE